MLRPGTRWIAMLLTALAAALGSLTASGAGAQAGSPTTVPLDWKVSVPSGANLVWRNAADIPVIITTGQRAATEVRLIQPILRDRESGAQVEFALCHQNNCSHAPTLQATRGHALFLRLRGKAFPGNYVGNIIIAAKEDPEGEAAEMSLYVSNTGSRLLGLAAIAAGVLLAWLLTVVIRNTIARRELQRALDLLEARKGSFETKLKTAFGAGAAESAPRCFAAFRGLQEDLAEAAGLLPPAIPTPWQGAWADRPRFETLVSAIDGRLDGLGVIVEDGLVPAAKIDTRAGREAVAAIDAKADVAGVLPLAELTRDVLALLAAARGAQFRAAGAPSRPAAGERYRVEVALLSAASWGVILAGTILAGMAALILPDKDFGRLNDFVVCLLWGLGVPVAGGQLTSLGGDSVRSALSVTRPA